MWSTPAAGVRLATAYVTQGMIRFITEQYAENLPLGCMLGYVMDGDLAFALSRVEAAILAHSPLTLQEGPNDIGPLKAVAAFPDRTSRLGGAGIDIRQRAIVVRDPIPGRKLRSGA